MTFAVIAEERSQKIWIGYYWTGGKIVRSLNYGISYLYITKSINEQALNEI